MASVTRELPVLDQDPWGATYSGKLTPELQAKICDRIANTAMNLEEVCLSLRITRQTFYRWMRWGEERRAGKFVNFRANVLAARAIFEHRATSAITSAGFVGSVTVTEKETVEIDDEGNEKVVGRVTTTVKNPPRTEPLERMLARRIPERYSEKLVTENTTRLEIDDGPRKLEVTYVVTDAMDDVRAPANMKALVNGEEPEDSEADTPVDKPEGS